MPLECLTVQLLVLPRVQKNEVETEPSEGEGFIPVTTLDRLPKGERKRLVVGSKQVVLLWYRNELFGVEARSPAEGAYSEGFDNSKLTQDGAILCPSTATKFDLRTERTLAIPPYARGHAQAGGVTMGV
eukprot:scaffold7843_cov376-Prasinococcus_capsulatus_cf.AAC.2